MDFENYQRECKKTAIYPREKQMDGIAYATLGLTGEAGEVANKVKKIIRDKGGIFSDGDVTALVNELGDVLWYAAALATELDVSLDMVATNNLLRLRARQASYNLGGSGDDR